MKGSGGHSICITAALLAVLLAAPLCGCEMPEWAKSILDSPAAETVFEQFLPSASVAPEDVPRFDDDSIDVGGDPEVDESILALERQVIINIHSFEDAAAIIADLPKAGCELTTFGTFVIRDEDLARIQREIDGFDTGRFDFGFLLMDLETGAGIFYNIDEAFFTASSIKAINLCAILYYHPEAFSRFYSYFRSALKNSNNEAYELIFNAYSDNIPNLWRARVGMPNQRWGRMYTNLTCRELAQLWCVTWDFLSQENEITEDLHVWLGESHHSCLAAVLGSREGYQVSAKAGWNPDSTEADTTCVEGGYVVTPDGTYLLVMMMDRAPYPDVAYADLVRALDDAYQWYVPRKARE